MDYRYKAKVLSIYDGDTMTLLVDLGFSTYSKEKVRLVGIDTPELRTTSTQEKIHAQHVRDYLRNLLLGKEVEINSKKKGKYGRYLVDIYFNGEHINQKLLDLGYAKPYDGGKKEPWY